MSGSDFNVGHEDILKAQQDKTVMFDVREDGEIQETGKLPGSIHIPCIKKNNFYSYLMAPLHKCLFVYMILIFMYSIIY